MKTKLILPIALLFFSLAANAQSPTKKCIDNADTIKVAIGFLNPIYSLSKSELSIESPSNNSLKINKVKIMFGILVFTQLDILKLNLWKMAIPGQ